MNKKKILFIIIITLSIISVVYIFLITKRSSKPSSTLNTPELTQKYKGKYSITTSLTKDQFNFPNKLPLLETTTSSVILTENRAKEVASNLGFRGDPTVFEDTFDGTTYFWKNDEATLFAYSKSGIIKYNSSLFSPGINKQLSNSSFLTIAQKLISDNKILDDSVFQIGNVKYLKQITNGEGFDLETNRANAVLFQISILPKNVEYEFVSASSVEPTSYVQLKQDGTLYSFLITTPPIIQKGFTEYNLKNFDGVVASLESAVLIELREETQLLSDVSSTLIQNIEIDKIEIAYLVESGADKTFQPVYKLSGNATLSNFQDKYRATLYLPAFATNQP
jgi:hypothetical protein